MKRLLLVGVGAVCLMGCPDVGMSGGEICTNGVDDDSNGLIDCADPDCAGQDRCPSGPFDGGNWGTCKKCGETCVAQRECIEESFANDSPLPYCAPTTNRCAQLNKASYYNLKLNLPGSQSFSTVALVRVVEKATREGNALSCATLKTASSSTDPQALEKLNVYNLAGWSSTPVNANSPFALMNLSRSATTSSFILFAELWNGQRDATSKYPVGTSLMRLGVGCLEAPASMPIVEAGDCDGGVMCYPSFTVDLQ